MSILEGVGLQFAEPMSGYVRLIRARERRLAGVVHALGSTQSEIVHRVTLNKQNGLSDVGMTPRIQRAPTTCNSSARVSGAMGAMLETLSELPAKRH